MLEFLLSVPALIKILVSLAVIIIINKLLKNQILGIFLGILTLSFWSGNKPSAILSISWERFSEINNIFLLVVVTIIIVLSSQMKETRIMQDLVTSITKRFSKHRSMAVLPSVIGLLPMPGGAVFSAPMVDSCDPDDRIDPSVKTRINYWFRHVWEYWWPLYPGVLLAIEISGLKVPVFVALMFPVTLFSVTAGWFFLLRKAGKDSRPERDPAQKEPLSHFLFLVSPIIIIIGSYTILGSLIPALSGISKYLPMVIGIVIAIVYIQIIRPLDSTGWKRILGSGKYFNMVLLVALIRIYGAFIEGRLPDGTLLMSALQGELAAAGIPAALLIMVIPMVCGISTGIAIGTVGAAFPIVMSLLGPDPTFAMVASTTVIAYAFGHMGQILSPVHVCLLVSNEYFKVGLGKSLQGLLKPVAVVLIAGFLLSRLYMIIL